METKHTHTHGLMLGTVSIIYHLPRHYKGEENEGRREEKLDEKEGVVRINMKRRVGEVCVSRKRGHNYSEVLTRN